MTEAFFMTEVILLKKCAVLQILLMKAFIYVTQKLKHIMQIFINYRKEEIYERKL